MLELSVLPLDYCSEAGVVATDSNWAGHKLSGKVRLERQCPETRIFKVSFNPIYWLNKVAQSCIIEGSSKLEILVFSYSSLHQLNTISSLGYHKLNFTRAGNSSSQRTIDTVLFIDDHPVCHWDIRIVENLDIHDTCTKNWYMIYKNILSSLS